MIFTFKYYVGPEEVRPTIATERRLRDECDPVIAVDCLQDIIYEATRLKNAIMRANR